MDIKIPKKYQDRVDSFKKYTDEAEWGSLTYEVNFKDGWEAEGSSLHYCESYRSALLVMADAHKGQELVTSKPKKVMKKEYKASFTRFGEPGKWFNAACWYREDNKRVFDTKEEAERALEYVKKSFPDKARREVMPAGSFGVVSEIDETTAHKIAVNETKIMVREVTDWEEVE